MRVVDLTHPIRKGMPVYPDDPALEVRSWTTRVSHGYDSEVVHMSTHTGTHMDAPSHFLAGRISIAEIPLIRCLLPGVLLDVHSASTSQLISSEVLAKAEGAFARSLVQGDAVLLWTGWSAHWGSGEYMRGHPALGADGAAFLVERRVGLVGIAGYICIEAVRRLGGPPLVNAGPMLAVAGAGLAANLVAARILLGGSTANLNLRAAFLHVASDALASVATLAAATAILAFYWYIADPLAGLGVGVMLVILAARLIRPAVHILLEGTPHDIDIKALETSILGQAGVLQVHDLHAWTLSSGYNAVTAHVVISDTVLPADREQVLDGLRHMIPDRFPVRHITIQLEESAECCDESHTPGLAATRPLSKGGHSLGGHHH